MQSDERALACGRSSRQKRPQRPGRRSAAGLTRSLLWFLFQPAAQGALPTLYAATAPDAKGGGYYGPDRLSETRGYPTEAAIPPHALGTATAARLWDVSQQLTGVTFQVTRSPIHPVALLDPRFSLSWE